MSGVRTLILIRHAHRDTSDRAADNGLSDKGRIQAKALVKHYLKAYPPGNGAPSLRVISSPKRRCVETVASIAECAEVSLELDSDLEEQRPDKNKGELASRAKHFISRWIQSDDPLVIACSHGDWLPVALHSATGARAELKKGGWAEIRIRDGERAQLRWLLQSLNKL